MEKQISVTLNLAIDTDTIDENTLLNGLSHSTIEYLNLFKHCITETIINNNLIESLETKFTKLVENNEYIPTEEMYAHQIIWSVQLRGENKKQFYAVSLHSDTEEMIKFKNTIIPSELSIIASRNIYDIDKAILTSIKNKDLINQLQNHGTMIWYQPQAWMNNNCIF